MENHRVAVHAREYSVTDPSLCLPFGPGATASVYRRSPSARGLAQQRDTRTQCGQVLAQSRFELTGISEGGLPQQYSNHQEPVRLKRV